ASNTSVKVAGTYPKYGPGDENVTAVVQPCSSANSAAAVAWAVSSKATRNDSAAGSGSDGSVDATNSTGTLPWVICSSGWPKSANGGPRIADTPASTRSWAARAVTSGSPSMFWMINSTGAPSTPPAQLIRFTKCSAAALAGASAK